MVMTYIFRDIVQNIRLQGHIHINSTSNPAEFSLPYIEHSINLVNFISCYL